MSKPARPPPKSKNTQISTKPPPNPPLKAPTAAQVPSKKPPPKATAKPPASTTPKSLPTAPPKVSPPASTKRPPSAPLASTRTAPAKAPLPRPSTQPASTKPAPAPAKADNWVNRTVQNRVAGWGDYAGGFFYGIGDRVNQFGQGVGNTISDSTRMWGQGVADYGNGIKDAVGVGGKRIPTTTNPLGLAGRGNPQNLPPGAKFESKKKKAPVRKTTAKNPLGLTE